MASAGTSNVLPPIFHLPMTILILRNRLRDIFLMCIGVKNSRPILTLPTVTLDMKF